MANLKNTNINDTGYIRPATGTTAQRPTSPQLAMIRWNTTDGVLEAWDGSSWKKLKLTSY